VILRGPSERKTARPFYRIAWDLFNYEEAYNSISWLLVLKDEYSGKLFFFDLKNKTQADIYPTIRDFESWIKRQYGLSICKLKHDGEKGVIAIQRKS
jgi:hypothetical protein